MERLRREINFIYDLLLHPQDKVIESDIYYL